MRNSVDPDEIARYEPSNLDLHCLQRYLYWSAGIEELKCDLSRETAFPTRLHKRLAKNQLNQSDQSSQGTL